MKSYTKILKSNEATRAVQSMNTTQRDILNTILRLNYQGELFSENLDYTLNLEKLAELTGISRSTAYRYFSELLQTVRPSIKFNPGNNENITKEIFLFSSITYNEGKSEISVRWTPDIIPHISGFYQKSEDSNLKIQGDNFTAIDYYGVTSLEIKNPSGKALYEYLQSYLFQKSLTISLTNLYTILNYTGQDYREFKRRILTPTIEWLSAAELYKINLEETKLAKGKVDSLTFTFTKLKNKKDKESDKFLADFRRKSS